MCRTPSSCWKAGRASKPREADLAQWPGYIRDYACQAIVEVASKSRSNVSWTGCGGAAAAVGLGLLPVSPGDGAAGLPGSEVGVGVAGRASAGTCSCHSWKWPLMASAARKTRLLPSGAHVG